MPDDDVTMSAIDRREAVRRVIGMLGGVSLVGGSTLIAACERARPVAAAAQGPIGEFSVDDIALLDEVADTILPPTSTPGAKAAHTGAFMALMVTDTYKPRDQQVFRAGMRSLDEACRAANSVSFMQATPAQRLALLEQLDREQKAEADERAAARKARAGQPRGGVAEPEAAKPDSGQANRVLPDQRKTDAQGTDAGAASEASEDPPAHYFRMMKQLTLVGYFTSEIGCTQALRYAESPGRYDPCVPYAAGERSWASHA